MASQSAHICQLAEAGGRPEFDLAPGGGAGGQVGRTSCATTFHRCSSPRTPSTMRSFSSTTSSVRTGRWSPGTAPCIKDGIGNLPKICRSKNMNPRDLRRVQVFYHPYLNVFTSTALTSLDALAQLAKCAPYARVRRVCRVCPRGCVPRSTFEIKPYGFRVFRERTLRPSERSLFARVCDLAHRRDTAHARRGAGGGRAARLHKSTPYLRRGPTGRWPGSTFEPLRPAGARPPGARVALCLASSHAHTRSAAHNARAQH